MTATGGRPPPNIADRFAEVEAVFEAVCDLPEAERGAALARLTPDDPELRAEVLSLLGYAAGAAQQIAGIIGREASHAAETPLSALASRRIGPYRLVRELGRGGMGVVYLAARDDDAYRTEVAIKLLHRGLETAHAVARFRDERQILATLEHPGIVRLLDGGNTAEGLPYLVMEYVVGAPISHWVAAQGLGVPARVALLRRVCAAVAYAHQRLVVHRDLKPGNILIAPDGAPKLLDFGIAKLVDPSASVGREAHTRTGMHLLTPEYASPEQIRGEPASTASDVYSLGVILYELLADVPAIRVAGAGLDGLRVVLEVDPPRASTVAPPTRRRAIAGDLDNILAKALQKDPARRYASVELLADDLGRHLDGQPVLARPATLAYRAGKFVRRSRGPLAALLLMVVALVTATGVSLQQARRADAQARRAEQRLAGVRRLANAMLFEVDGKIVALADTAPAREVLVDRSLEYLDSLVDEASDDPALARELAGGYIRIAEIQGGARAANLGRPDDAAASHAKAQRLLGPLAASGQADVATLWAWARLLIATGRSREAVPLVESLPLDATFDHRLVVDLHLLEMAALIREGDPAAGLRAGQRGLAAATQWAAATDSPDARGKVAAAHDRLAEHAHRTGDVAAARRDVAAARPILAALTAEQPLNVVYRQELAQNLVLAVASEPAPGFVEALQAPTAVAPEWRCELLTELAAAWRAWQGPPTPDTRRRTAALEAARAACQAGLGPRK